MSDAPPAFHNVSEGGASAEHASPPAVQALVAPTNSANELDTLREFILNERLQSSLAIQTTSHPCEAKGSPAE